MTVGAGLGGTTVLLVIDVVEAASVGVGPGRDATVFVAAEAQRPAPMAMGEIITQSNLQLQCEVTH